MSFVRTKIQKGREYFYEVENTREGDMVRQKVLRYLGPKKVHCDKKQIVSLIDLLGQVETSDELKTLLFRKDIECPDIDIDKLQFIYDIKHKQFEISYY